MRYRDLLLLCILVCTHYHQAATQRKQVASAGIVTDSGQVSSNADLSAQMGSKLSDHQLFSHQGVQASTIELSSTAKVSETDITTYEEVYPLIINVTVPPSADLTPKKAMQRWKEINPLCRQYNDSLTSGPPGYIWTDRAKNRYKSIYGNREPSTWDKERITQERVMMNASCLVSDMTLQALMDLHAFLDTEEYGTSLRPPKHTVKRE